MMLLVGHHSDRNGIWHVKLAQIITRDPEKHQKSSQEEKPLFRRLKPTK